MRWLARWCRGQLLLPGGRCPVAPLQNPRVNIVGIRRGDLLPDPGILSPTRLLGSCADCWTSGSSESPPEPTATTLPRPNGLRRRRRNDLPRRLSFRSRFGRILAGGALLRMKREEWAGKGPSARRVRETRSFVPVTFFTLHKHHYSVIGS